MRRLAGLVCLAVSANAAAEPTRTPVLISSSVPECSVSIDGVAQAERTPLAAELVPGSHLIKVHCGTAEWHTVIDVSEGTPLKVFADLESAPGQAATSSAPVEHSDPAPTTSPSDVALNSISRSGLNLYLDVPREMLGKQPTRVFVDGVESKGTPGGGRITLEPGEHLVGARFGNGVISEQVYRVEAGRVDTAHLTLDVKTLPPKAVALDALVRRHDPSNDGVVVGVAAGLGALVLILILTHSGSSSNTSAVHALVQF